MASLLFLLLLLLWESILVKIGNEDQTLSPSQRFSMSNCPFFPPTSLTIMCKDKSVRDTPLLSYCISGELKQTEVPGSWSRVLAPVTLPKEQRLCFLWEIFCVLLTTANTTAMVTELLLVWILSTLAQRSALHDAMSSKAAPTDSLFLAPSMDDSCRYTLLLARRNFLEYCQIQTELERWQFPKK